MSETTSWQDEDYGLITDEYRTADFRAVIQPPQPPFVGYMDTEGVWTLRWTDYVANEWAEAFPDRHVALQRLRELMSAVEVGGTLPDYLKWLAFEIGDKKAHALAWRNYIEAVNGAGYNTTMHWEWVQGSERIVAKSSSLIVNDLPLIEVLAWEPDPGLRRTICFRSNGGHSAYFHEAAPLDESAAETVTHLLASFDEVARLGYHAV